MKIIRGLPELRESLALRSILLTNLRKSGIRIFLGTRTRLATTEFQLMLRMITIVIYEAGELQRPTL